MRAGTPANPASSLVIRNVVVGGRRTSVRLEPVMWDALRDIAQRQGVTIHDLVTDIERERTASSLTAAIRVRIVDFYRAAAVQPGQTPASRGTEAAEPPGQAPRRHLV